MRIPQMNSGLRTSLLGLGMFMIALSTVADFTSAMEQDEQWDENSQAMVAEAQTSTGTHECRTSQEFRPMERLQSL